MSSRPPTGASSMRASSPRQKEIRFHGWQAVPVGARPEGSLAAAERAVSNAFEQQTGTHSSRALPSSGRQDSDGAVWCPWLIPPERERRQSQHRGGADSGPTGVEALWPRVARLSEWRQSVRIANDGMTERAGDGGGSKEMSRSAAVAHGCHARERRHGASVHVGPQ